MHNVSCAMFICFKYPFGRALEPHYGHLLCIHDTHSVIATAQRGQPRVLMLPHLRNPAAHIEGLLMLAGSEAPRLHAAVL
jgi:hypothetical protein